MRPTAQTKNVLEPQGDHDSALEASPGTTDNDTHLSQMSISPLRPFIITVFFSPAPLVSFVFHLLSDLYYIPESVSFPHSFSERPFALAKTPLAPFFSSALACSAGFAPCAFFFQRRQRISSLSFSNPVLSMRRLL